MKPKCKKICNSFGKRSEKENSSANNYLSDNYLRDLSMKDPDEEFALKADSFFDAEDNDDLHRDLRDTFVESNERVFSENENGLFLMKRSSEEVDYPQLRELLSTESFKKAKTAGQEEARLPERMLDPNPEAYICNMGPKPPAPRMDLKRPGQSAGAGVPNAPKKFDHCAASNQQFLDESYRFIVVYFAEEKPKQLEKKWRKLKPRSREVVSCFLRKINKEKDMTKILNYSSFKKRNEEVIKMVYKPAIKHFYKVFQRKARTVMEVVGRSGLSCTLQNFHYHCFEELIESRAVPMDVVMDITAELTNENKKRGLLLTRRTNWRTVKFRKLRKISTHYRYLIKRTTRFSAQFQDFINKKLVGHFKKIIRDKLEKKKGVWDHMLRSSADFRGFMSAFQRDLKKKKFKCPWPIRAISRSIAHCLREFNDNTDLENNFESLKAVHYSYKDSSN